MKSTCRLGFENDPVKLTPGMANLYDELDPLYREIWSDSLHHGRWASGKESAEEARENLIQLCLSGLQPSAGKVIADIGCGYGQLCQRLITEYNCEALGWTNSAAQVAAARCQITHEDWLENDLVPESLGGAIALESLSHFESFSSFFKATTPALRPGARLVIADWFSTPECTGLERMILGHIANTGEIPAFRPLDQIPLEGFSIQQSYDLSAQVAPTWSTLFRKSLATPRLYPRFLWHSLRRPPLLWIFPLVYLAYKIGILRYRITVLRKDF